MGIVKSSVNIHSLNEATETHSPASPVLKDEVTPWFYLQCAKKHPSQEGDRREWFKISDYQGFSIIS